MIKKKSRFFELYIYKVINQLSNKYCISSNTKNQINNILFIISKSISYYTFIITQFTNKNTISYKQISYSLHFLLSGDLLINCIQEGNNAINTYLSNISHVLPSVLLNNSKTTLPYGNKTNKAGILFPPSILEKFLRDFGYFKIRITNTSSIFLAAVLEYITYEILDVALVYTLQNKRITINTNDLILGRNNDIEINNLFNKLHIIIFNPTLKLFFSQNKIKNIIKFIISSKFKISHNASILLQKYIEYFISNILKNAYKITLYTGRKTLFSNDLDLIQEIKSI
jgi:histone H3/H4